MSNVYTTLAGESFKEPNIAPLAAARWTLLSATPGLQIQSTVVRVRTTLAVSAQFWSTGTGLIFPPNQFSDIANAGNFSNSSFLGALVRGVDDGSGHINGYAFCLGFGLFFPQNFSWGIVRFDSSVPTVLIQALTHFNPITNDVVRTEAQNSSIAGFYNGKQIFQVTDPTYSSGQAGIIMEGSGAFPSCKNWDGGSITLTINPALPPIAPVPFTIRTTSAVAVANCLFVASATGAQLLATPSQVLALQLEFAQLVVEYSRLNNQATANNRIDLYAAIAQAIATVTNLQATLAGIVVFGQDAVTLAKFQSTTQGALKALLNAQTNENQPGDE